MTDPYALPHGVLRNLLGITDPGLLALAEADITNARLISLRDKPVRGNYDIDHLCRLHAHIFGDIYPWAGTLRTVEISKHTPFCPLVHLRSYAAEIFGRLRSADFLRGLTRVEFVRGLAELYGDINALHPFREGNGRTQRAFLQQLTADAGYIVSWDAMDAERNQQASVKSFLGDNAPLQAMLDSLIVRK